MCEETIRRWGFAAFAERKCASSISMKFFCVFLRRRHGASVRREEDQRAQRRGLQGEVPGRTGERADARGPGAQGAPRPCTLPLGEAPGLGWPAPFAFVASAGGNDFAVRAAVARAHDTARACRLACAIGHGRRARHPDSGSRATSLSRAHQ